MLLRNSVPRCVIRLTKPYRPPKRALFSRDGALLLLILDVRSKRLICVVYFSCGFGSMNTAIDMIRRCVDRVQLQRHLAGIDHVVRRARGNHENISSFQRTLRGIQVCGSCATLDNDRLLYMRMGFKTNISARRNAHDNELALFSSKEHLSVIVVGPGFRIDICLIRA